MPDYTYPYIFPDLRENPRDLETWLSANVVNQDEGDSLWAASTHQHADAIRINATTTAGGSLPTSEGTLAYTEITEGVPADSEVLVDVTIQVEVASVPAGAYWGARIGVQDVAQGSLMYRQGQTHSHSVSASGSAASDGNHQHTVTATSGEASSSHRHPQSGTTNTPSPTSTGAESSHVHSGPSHTHDPQGDVDTYYGTPTHDHGTSLMTNTYAGTGSTGSTSHSHSLNSHTHGYDTTTDYAGAAHTHSLSAAPTSNTGAHTHTVSATGSADSQGGGMTKDNTIIHWVGIVDTGVTGTIKLSALAAASQAGGTWTKVSFIGLVWVIPTVLASQLGGLDDIADVAAPSPADGQVLTWSTPANAWIAQDSASSAGGWAGRMLLMGG